MNSFRESIRAPMPSWSGAVKPASPDVDARVGRAT